MKVLKGSLTETRYPFPDLDKDEPMAIVSEQTYEKNAVAYMADELGVHKVWNKGSDFAVSLHRKQTQRKPRQPCHLTPKVYTPPNVTKGGCNVFNEKTGRSSHISKCGYYSVYGKMLREQEGGKEMCHEGTFSFIS